MKNPTVAARSYWRFLLPIVCIATIVACTTKETSTQPTWYAFNPDNDFSKPSAISMHHWLDAPAGKHGFVQMQDDKLVFENGQRIKFWGVNICGSNAFPDPEKAQGFTDMLSFMGVNGVRFHKFTWSTTNKDSSTLPDSTAFTRMDYFQHLLRESGIYYGWSHIYGHKVRPADSTRLVAYHEIAALEYPWRHLNATTASLVNFAPDLQALNIELTVNMLNRVNPHTGLRYAEDPALAFIEFQNEDNIFWGAIEKSLEQAPTYRAMLCRQFSEWLKAKYQTDAALKRAWGEHLPANESLAQLNVYPTPNHGVFSAAYEQSLKTGEAPQHILDKLQFLFEKQVEFYQQFEQAVRATGYKGTLVGSCWQAGSGFSHFYNLYADYLVGMVDRHNYFGGGKGGHRLDTGFVRSASMLGKPGSGLLGTGMQMVADRPFAISEWMSLIPNPWVIESSPIIATYGMGLQGWDASFAFAVDLTEYTSTLQSVHGVYNVTSPNHLALYPALAAMIYRGDVREAPVITPRKVHIPSLSEGKLGFVDRVSQGYDDKSFSGSIPAEALAVGKIPIAFTAEYQLTDTAAFQALRTAEPTGSLKSLTGELNWQYDGEQGVISINTAGTKGLIGFGSEQAFDLDGWELSTSNQFAVVYLSSLTPDKYLDNADKILVTAIGKAKNTGMIYEADGSYLADMGEAPILLEGVQLSLKPGRSGKAFATVLDHMGRTTETTIRPDGQGRFTFNGGQDKAIYYLIEFEE